MLIYCCDIPHIQTRTHTSKFDLWILPCRGYSVQTFERSAIVYTGASIKAARLVHTPSHARTHAPRYARTHPGTHARVALAGQTILYCLEWHNIHRRIHTFVRALAPPLPSRLILPSDHDSTQLPNTNHAASFSQLFCGGLLTLPEVSYCLTVVASPF
jgi:hypothetical protein